MGVLVPEDGTGLPNADSYGSVQDVSDLLAEIGLGSKWDLIDSDLQIGLCRRSTSIIDSSFMWRGCILKTTQSLEFPRRNLCDSSRREIIGLPRALKESWAELAYTLSSTNFLADPGAMSARSLKVGPIEISTNAASEIKKMIPDSVIQKLSQFGSYRFARRGFRKISF